MSSKSRDTASDLAIGSERDRVKHRVKHRARGSARARGSERVTDKSREDNQTHATSNTKKHDTCTISNESKHKKTQLRKVPSLVTNHSESWHPRKAASSAQHTNKTVIIQPTRLHTKHHTSHIKQCTSEPARSQTAHN